MEIKVFNQSIEKFIESLNKEVSAKVIHTIDLLEKFGGNLSLPHSKMISRGMFELRIYGSQNIRIFYTFYKNKAILLHGFIKKNTQDPKTRDRSGNEKDEAP